MFDIITFGSATQDIHLKSKAFKIVSDSKDFNTGKGICLNLGSKIDVEDIVFSNGGGGTNTAATFAKQGFKTAFYGAIGVDPAGLEIVRELKLLHVNTSFVIKKKERRTNNSIIISADGTDRTILVYRGASDILSDKDIKWSKIKKTKWIYLAPLGGMMCENFEKMVDFAKENKIKVAVNPSIKQLSLPEDKLRKIFGKIDVLFLNQEEASYLTKVPFQQEHEIFTKARTFCPGVVVMTKGGDGVVVSDGKNMYSAKVNPSRKFVDATGGGDSFAAGFLSAFIRSDGDISEGVRLGLSNSEANVGQIGAKSGILEKDAVIEKREVLKTNL